MIMAVLKMFPETPSRPAAPCRWRLHLRGVVQGVGFRPWCLRQARSLGLAGWVRNDAQGLCCEVQGSESRVWVFVRRLRQEPPPLARIDACRFTELALEADATFFAIRESQVLGFQATGLPADTAPCEDCLDELFDPHDRRWRHPFINCTACGPRYTVANSLPYDRPRTSLAAFPMCADCAAEYGNPADRRHHAQPIACPRCGPRLSWLRADGTPLTDADPLEQACALIARGGIVAIKGVGGYQLLCDATQSAAVARLRERKQRPHKPLALLTPNVASARQWVHCEAAAARLLQSPRRPIILLPARADALLACPGLAPDLSEWGLALPASPLHWLLVHQALGRPDGAGWRGQAQPLLWVMTSANPRGEPLAIDETEVLRLRGLADGFLVHDRPIAGRADDSVRRPLGLDRNGRLYAPFIRRARGYVPEPILLPGVPDEAPPVLATGAWLKNTICLTRGNEAFVSPHIGDLSTAAACRSLDDMVRRWCDFLDVRPVCVAHDLHPDFFSTRHALALAEHWRVPSLGVQHHHAHAAAVALEHGLGETLSLILDGVGLGDDGLAWGGELLHVCGARFRRLAHLPLLAMPGGDRAASEPWRMGAAVLAQLGRAAEIAAYFPAQPLAPAVAAWLQSARGIPRTSSAGRLFDAAAALLGLCECMDYESQAALRLEALAQDEFAQTRAWPDAWSVDASGQLSLDGLYQILADSPARTDARLRPQEAARLHRSLGDALTAWALWHGKCRMPALPVVLGGGCWANRLLRNHVVSALRAQGLAVHEAQAVPAGDGGLSLGQAAVALASCCNIDVGDATGAVNKEE